MRVGVVFSAAVVIAGLTVPASAQQSVDEAALKAAFVFNFIKFVDWPDGAFGSPDAPISVCRWSQASRLPGLDGKTAKGRAIRVQPWAAQDKVDGCHVVYVDGRSQKQAALVVDRTAGRAILSVGDFGEFAHRGGLISLTRVGDRLSFSINVDAMRRSNLKVSSQLLNLAKIVRGSQ